MKDPIKRLPEQKGRISHLCRTWSIPLDSRWLPSALSLMPVTVSLCPSRENKILSARRSQQWMRLSRPPQKARELSSEKATDVMGNLCFRDAVEYFQRVSHNNAVQSSEPVRTKGSPRLAATIELTCLV